MAEERSEGLLVKAQPLEQAERISRSMVAEVQVVDGTLLLGADPAWAGAINTVLVWDLSSWSGRKPLTRRPAQPIAP